MIFIETCPKCGADIKTIVKCTYPPILVKQCRKCDWYWKGTKEVMVRVPFVDPHTHEVQADGT